MSQVPDKEELDESGRRFYALNGRPIDEATWREMYPGRDEALEKGGDEQ